MPFDATQPDYLALREAALPDTNRLIIWCGAGLGRPAGLPGWADLRRKLVVRLTEKARKYNDSERQSIEKQINSFQGQPNHWVALQFLQERLGHTTFRASIREVLAPAATGPIPPVYEKLWRLRLAGMVTLNLDAFASRAFSSVHPGKLVVSFPGKWVAEYTHVLRTPNVPFLCHLHGLEHDASSWVFTHDELSELMKNDGYHTFLTSILTQSTVLFIGLSADDVAVGGHLQRLKDKKIDFGAHYWVTHRNDVETDRWAENTGIRTICYRTWGHDHTELGEMLDALVSYVPADDRTTAYPPVLHGSSLAPVATLPPPEEVRTMEPDQIRRLLNGKALNILRPENPDRDRQFAAFVEEYDYPIHNAWFVSTAEGKNMLVGYKLKSSGSKGAFGQIFKAEDANGRPVAIKLLKAEIRTDPRLLHSFRRGVQAMRILSERRVRGMVAYKEASEIPAFVAMDWIDGHDLRQAVRMNLLDSWETLLDVALKIASILKEAHSLPERVLHRDLRPANIMLRRQKASRPWDVVLLDFDLSWYLGSVEQSVVFGSDSYGYLAPEQIHEVKDASSRHPAVDSYGLGMTLFFAISGTNPSPDNHRHEGWSQSVLQAAARRKKSPWVSVGQRFARLILNLTHDRQSMRWDLSQAVLELQRMLDAVRRPGQVRFADMLAEEVAARSGALSTYEWDDDAQAATLAVRQAGLTMALAGSGKTVELRLARIRAEHDERWKSPKRVVDTNRQLGEILRSGGWVISQSKADSDHILIRAQREMESVATDLDKVATLVDRVEKAIPRT